MARRLSSGRPPASGPRPFESLLDGLPYPLVGLDGDGHILLINQQAELVCGRTAEEVQGLHYRELFPEELPEDPEGATVTCACDGGSSFTAEVETFDMPAGGPGCLLLQIRPKPAGGATCPIQTGDTYPRHDLLLTEALLRAQLATTPDGIVVADGDHRVLLWNQRFVTMWGIPEDILIAGQGAEALAAVTDKLVDPEAFQAEVMRLYRNLDEPEDGVEIRLRDGRVLERHSRGVQDDRGFYWGRAWYYRDITERKRIEEARAASENRFRAIFERSPLGIAVVAPDSRPLVVNPALTRMIGRSPDELKAMRFEEFTHPDDVPPIRELFEDLKAGRRQSIRFTQRYVTKDGSVVRVRLSGSTLPGLADDGGDLYLALVEDVTEHSALEEGLRLVAEVLRTANAVMITDRRGRILSVNEAFSRITGFAAAEVAGCRARTLDAEPEDAAAYRDMKAALDWQDTWEGEVQGRRKDGSTYPMWETITAIRDESGRVVRYVSVFTDLTERKMLASERQRRSSAIGELGRLLAHQLNQPLAAIGGYADGARMRLQRGEVATGQLDSVLERIGDQARRAGEVVADMRHYFRGEPPAAEPVGLNTLLHSILPILPEGGEAPYRLDLDLAEDLPEVLADPVQVQECLVNMVTNAIEAGPAEAGGEVLIRITTRRRDGRVELAVADNGPGVPEGLEQQIFQPLFTTKGTGSGLGLPICMFVAEEHGGRMWLASNAPAPGTTFYLSLPVAHGGPAGPA
jgi:PAS domain S-box-containing protein